VVSTSRTISYFCYVYYWKCCDSRTISIWNL